VGYQQGWFIDGTVGEQSLLVSSLLTSPPVNQPTIKEKLKKKNIMKLTKNTTPQAKNYQCNKCKAICSHREMHDDDICYDCYDKLPENVDEKN